MINKITRIKKIPSSPAEAMKGYPETNTKYYIILEHMRKGGSINKYEAMHLGVNCLDSIICTMCKDFNLEVSRHTEKSKDISGCYSYATRYKFTKQDMIKIILIKREGSDE